ncbi:DUF4132 domain-containing protein [Nocardia fusca]|uniref:DUF4132 domain-containing protein n=1 Tax=Nocardia fusca TaxID=941183 RepID=UPI003788BB61
MTNASAQYTQSIRNVLALIAAGDTERLVPALLALGEMVDSSWSGESREIVRVLHDVDAQFQSTLEHDLIARWATAPKSVQRLTSFLRGRAARADRRRRDRQSTVHYLAAKKWQWDTMELAVLAELELAEGRELPGDFVALIRRSHLGRSTFLGVSTLEDLGPLVEGLTSPVVNPGEAWSDRALADLTDLGADWHRLVAHAATATAVRPSAKWERAGRALIDAVGAEDVRTRIPHWLRLVGRPRTQLVDYGSEIDPYNANALRGLAWLFSFLPAHPETVRTLGHLVEASLRKVPGRGPLSPKLANAGVNALARIDGADALAELARLATRITYKGTLELVNKALNARAQAEGRSREEIEELAVPAYGLTDVGLREHRLSDATALLEVHGARAILSWRNAAGKAVKSVPAAVRRDHADELEELKTAVKDIDKMLSAQNERLDRQFLARRTWSYDSWRERYLDHPLVGTLARRLLWTIDGTTVGYADGQLCTLVGTPVTGGSEVRLWHPLGHEPADIVAWRDWLERHRITQPFKQAHREVYVLTDAERKTGTYSNRFAAHILRQHQFHALAAVRGWRNKLRLCVDDEAPPATRELPEWGLRAEYWIEGDGDYDDTTESGSYLRLRTDQVRFYPIDAPHNWAHCDGGEYRMRLHDGADPVEPLSLESIPPLVLSEILRDVDLFVGVASVGNDPTWHDGGPGGHFREYWSSYSFGELDHSAQTRRVVLARLIPRLAIADRCTLEGRFLHVEGERHTYKIHLGSGNILMTPNDRYLCIVPKSGAGVPQTGYQPFEGDRMLTVILSKAMMLAADTKITDRTIVSQL